MAIDLSESWIKDVREPIAGDSYNWEGTEPAPAKNAIIIHHSGTNSATAAEDAFTIANFHVNSRGWGGIGYHFVITHDNHPDGAQVQYAGDLLSWRAHILNQNPGKIGICLTGNFLVERPGMNQLQLARQLIDFLLAPNMIMPSLNYYSQIYGHGLYPNQQTAGEQCPGFAGADFNEWYGYLRGGALPSWYNVPAPSPTPPQPAPPVAPPSPQPPVDTRPDYVQTWKPSMQDGSPMTAKVVAVPSADITDVSTDKQVGTLAGGTPLAELAGTLTHKGETYVRTAWSVANNKWNGILLSEVKDPETPAAAAEPIVNTNVPVDSIQPPVAPPADALINDPGMGSAGTATVMPQADPQEVSNALGSLWEAIVGIILSPLRLIGLIAKALNNLRGK